MTQQTQEDVLAQMDPGKHDDREGKQKARTNHQYAAVAVKERPSQSHNKVYTIAAQVASREGNARDALRIMPSAY